MQKINLSLKNVTAIPVTKALRAVKGDYILVEGDGSTSVVPSSVFKAMSVLQSHRQTGSQSFAQKVLQKSLKKTPTEARNYIFSVCRSMKEKNVLESVKVDAPNVMGDVRPVSLWALKDRTTQPLTNGAVV